KDRRREKTLALTSENGTSVGPPLARRCYVSHQCANVRIIGSLVEALDACPHLVSTLTCASPWVLLYRWRSRWGMLGLEKIVAGAKLRAVAGPTVVDVVRVEWIGSDALNVVYCGMDGPAEMLAFCDAEPRLELVQASRAFSLDGDGEAFRIASQAQRIR